MLPRRSSGRTRRAELTPERRTVVLHLQGRLDSSPERAWESFAITEDDFIHYGDVAGRLPVALAARLRRTHLLLLGYTLSDWTLRVVLGRLWGEEPPRYSSWSVHAGPPPLEREFWRRRNVDVIDMAPAAYMAELERVVAGAAAMSALPASPYKGLAAFGDSPVDSLLFFGREPEREAIVANLLANRLTILYGSSGVGKSSLLGAGVAQRLRAVGDGVVIVHAAWAEDPEAGVVASAHDADPELGPTAGLVDTVAAAAQRNGQVFLLLDQFEEYFLHHGDRGPLADVLPELLRRPGLRVNVLIALRDDALAELDAFAGRLPDLFANMLRLDRADRDAARSAVVGPLERYGELAGATYGADPALVEELLDDVAVGRVDLGGETTAPLASERIEAPFLQLVLERLWAEEAAAGSRELRLETFHGLGGAEPILREHVFGTLDRLPGAEQDEAARLVRQLVTPSGTKTSHSAEDLADYAEVDPARLQSLLALLAGERIVRVVEGTAGGPSRYEIFHDVLASPLLAWRAGHELARERVSARQQRRRLLALTSAALLALVVVGAIAVFALVQRSSARSEARRAHARELAADALASIPSNPTASLALALRAAKLFPAAQTESVLRSSLLAKRELHVVRLGGSIVAARFSPSRDHLLLASTNGAVGIYDTAGRRVTTLPRQHQLTQAVWSQDGTLVATGDAEREGHRVARLRWPCGSRNPDDGADRRPRLHAKRTAHRQRRANPHRSDGRGPRTPAPRRRCRRRSGSEPGRTPPCRRRQATGPHHDRAARCPERPCSNDAPGAGHRLGHLQRRRATSGDRQHRQDGPNLERDDRTAAPRLDPERARARRELLA